MSFIEKYKIGMLRWPEILTNVDGGDFKKMIFRPSAGSR